MLAEELDRYAELNKIFNSNCKRVVSILANCQEFCMSYRNVSFAESFMLEGDQVHWEGTEYEGCGEYANHQGYFLAAYLLLSDEELTKLVREKQREYEERLEREALAREKRKEESEYLQYLELKKKYDKDEHIGS